MSSEARGPLLFVIHSQLPMQSRSIPERKRIALIAYGQYKPYQIARMSSSAMTARLRRTYPGTA